MNWSKCYLFRIKGVLLYNNFYYCSRQLFVEGKEDKDDMRIYLFFLSFYTRTLSSKDLIYRFSVMVTGSYLVESLVPSSSGKDKKSPNVNVLKFLRFYIDVWLYTISKCELFNNTRSFKLVPCTLDRTSVKVFI